VNGALVRISPSFRLSSRDLTGQLIVGNHPLVDNGWQGQVKGLAVYNRELIAAEVLQHYEAWTTNHQAEIKNENPVALYLFNEGMGNVVHNQMNSETDLHIPERYFVLHAPFHTGASRTLVCHHEIGFAVPVHISYYHGFGIISARSEGWRG
jgi:hypothetical protein